MVLVYITCKDRKEALRISEHLLAKKLIACANIFPIESIYRWENKIQQDKEYAALGKTIKSKFDSIIKEVQSIHSYDLPCISLLDSGSESRYEAWVKKEIA
ncbi:divalent cation tolerance protein CutA [Candidatus Woesearchaeota archaeon]|nr:divalent cation tolerance protein CutA [Candidatus Woesearchaeota archaeon]